MHYKVENKIDIVMADAFDILRGKLLQLRPLSPVDVILLAPPWGGMEYAERGRSFDLHTMFSFGDGFDLIGLALSICKNVVFLVPKNTHKVQFEELAK